MMFKQMLMNDMSRCSLHYNLYTGEFRQQSVRQTASISVKISNLALLFSSPGQTFLRISSNRDPGEMMGQKNSAQEYTKY